jgi:VanZ family protein
MVLGMLARGRKAVKKRGALRLLRWLPALAWMAFIFSLSQQSAPLGASGSSGAAAFAHIVLYATLAFLLGWALAGGAAAREAPLWVLAALAFSLAVQYGVTDELHQAFVGGRSASELDLALDAAGALLGTSALSTHRALAALPGR